jgi:hypothetical protein
LLYFDQRQTAMAAQETQDLSAVLGGEGGGPAEDTPIGQETQRLEDVVGEGSEDASVSE